MAAKLTESMKYFLNQITHDWGPLPPHHSITNLTLKGLEKRGLVEVRGINVTNGRCGDFQIRKTKAAS